MRTTIIQEYRVIFCFIENLKFSIEAAPPVDGQDGIIDAILFLNTMTVPGPSSKTVGLSPQILFQVAPPFFALDPTKKMTKLLTSLDTKGNIRDLNLNYWYEVGHSCGGASIVKGFSANKNMAISPAGNPTSIQFPSCPSLTSTCCTEGTLKNIEMNGKLAYQKYTQWYEAVIPILRFMIFDLWQPKYMKQRPNDIWNLQCVGDTQRSTCEALYINIVSAKKLFEKYEKQYIKYMSKCHLEIQKLSTEVNCAFCDPENNQYIHKSNNEIIWKRKVVDKAIKACYNYDLLNEKIVRPVFVAYLAYARQVDPTMDIDEKILYNMTLFKSPVSKCQDWVTRTQATSKSDFTGSLSCLKFGFSKIRLILENGKDLKFDPYFVKYLKNVVNTQATTRIQNRLSDILPITLLPFNVYDRSDFPLGPNQGRGPKRILEDESASKIKKFNEQQNNLAKKRPKPMPTLQEQPGQESWKFLLANNHKDGIDQSRYEDNTLPQAPVYEIINSAGYNFSANLLKSWVTVILAFGLFVTFCY